MAVLLGQLPLTLARPKIFHRLYLRFLLAYPPNYLPDAQTSSQNSNFAPQPLESDSPKWNSSQNSPSWVMQAMVASPKIISLKEQASSMTMAHNSTSRFLATDYDKVYSDKPKPDIVRAPPIINQPSSTQYAKSTTPSWILKAILESSNSSFKRWSPPLSAQAAKDRYNTGLTDYFDYIVAEQIRLQTAARKATLTAEQLSASVRLIQALGGGFQTSEGT